MKYFCLIIFLLGNLVFAQSEQFASHSRYMQKDNPSYFGYNNLNKVGVLYNSIAVNSTERLDNKYFYGNISFDQFKFSLGFEVHALKIQRNGLANTLANLSYIYKLQLNTNTYFLPAITIGFGSSSVNINDFIFEDQLNATTGFINTETIDPLGNDLGNVNYLDLGASFVIHNDRFIIGMSLKHLNGPNTSFNKEKESKKPILIGLQGGYEFDLNPYERSFLSRYTFLYTYGALSMHQGVAVLNLSQDLQLGAISFGLSEQFSKRTTPQLNNIGIAAALSIENFDFGLQYNFPMRNLKSVYAPSVLELFVTFNFSQFRRNNRGLYKRLQIDNYL